MLGCPSPVLFPSSLEVPRSGALCFLSSGCVVLCNPCLCSCLYFKWWHSQRHRVCMLSFLLMPFLCPGAVEVGLARYPTPIHGGDHGGGLEGLKDLRDLAWWHGGFQVEARPEAGFPASAGITPAALPPASPPPPGFKDS